MLRRARSLLPAFHAHSLDSYFLALTCIPSCFTLLKRPPALPFLSTCLHPSPPALYRLSAIPSSSSLVSSSWHRTSWPSSLAYSLTLSRLSCNRLLIGSLSASAHCLRLACSLSYTHDRRTLYPTSPNTGSQTEMTYERRKLLSFLHSPDVCKQKQKQKRKATSFHSWPK